MGAKTWMLVYSEGSAREILKSRPPLDREATAKLAELLFPDEKLIPIGEGDLSDTSPPSSEIHMGCFPGASVVAATEFGIDYPSKLPRLFIDAGAGGTIHLHAMHSVVDWHAFALWIDGKLQRSLSLSPDSGILEDIGARLPFEEAYWAGEHPAVEHEAKKSEYPLPFHPLELGEATLHEFFGYQLEGPIDRTLLDPTTIPLMIYNRSRPWWKFWR